jgi:hypothetical protein
MRIRMTVVAAAVLVMGGALVNDSPAQSTIYSRQVPENLAESLNHFLDSIEAKRWDDALRQASPRVRARIEEVGSAQAFVQQSVPVAELAQLRREGVPMFNDGLSRTRDGLSYGTSRVELKDDLGRRHFWRFRLQETSAGVELDMPVMPIARYLDVVSKYAVARDEHTSRMKALAGERLKGVSLRVETENPEFGPGEEIPVRLMLVNPTAEEVYAHGSRSLVHFFGKYLRVVGPGGVEVPRVSPVMVSISIGPIGAPAGTEAALFDWTDLRTAFEVGAPGEYSIEFTPQSPKLGVYLPESEAKGPPYPEELSGERLLSSDPGWTRGAETDQPVERAGARFRIR